MTTANKMLLEKMKQEIKQRYELSNIAFSTWIEPLESISVVKDGRIDITMRRGYTDIGIEYVKKKYGIFMKDFLNAELGIKSDLRFIIMDDDKKPDPERNEK